MCFDPTSTETIQLSESFYPWLVLTQMQCNGIYTYPRCYWHGEICIVMLWPKLHPFVCCALQHNFVMMLQCTFLHLHIFLSGNLCLRGLNPDLHPCSQTQKLGLTLAFFLHFSMKGLQVALALGKISYYSSIWIIPSCLASLTMKYKLK